MDPFERGVGRSRPAKFVCYSLATMTSLGDRLDRREFRYRDVDEQE